MRRTRHRTCHQQTEDGFVVRGTASHRALDRRSTRVSLAFIDLWNCDVTSLLLRSQCDKADSTQEGSCNHEPRRIRFCRSHMHYSNGFELNESHVALLLAQRMYFLTFFSVLEERANDRTRKR